MTYTGPIAGMFTVDGTSVNWSISNSVFDYDNAGNITSGNPVSFLLTADGGADSIPGTIYFGRVENLGSTTAEILGGMTLGAVSFGSSTVDTALAATLVSELDAPSVSFLNGLGLGFTLNLTDCTDGDCVVFGSSPDPTGVASSVTLSNTANVPEPGTLVLLGIGLAAIGIWKRSQTA